MKTKHQKTIGNGKIARFPQVIWDELNRRLDDREPTARILEWLNALSATQALLNAEFGGRRVNEQNLSNWRLGGYQNWLKQRERCNFVRQLTENARELTADADGVPLSNLVSTVVVAELAASHRDMLATITDPAQRCAHEQKLLRTLAHVSREDVRAGKLQMERERRARERAREKREEEEDIKDAPHDRFMDRCRMGILFNEPDLNCQADAIEYAESLLQETEPDQPGSPVSGAGSTLNKAGSR
jgi:DNA primase